MKIVEALKQCKDLQRKVEDLQKKISTYCVYLTTETPMYEDQKRQVSEWLQSQSDVIKEILRLRTAIQKTNLEIKVSIEIGEKIVTKTIAEWIHRRRDLAKLESLSWQKLTDKGMREEGYFKNSLGEMVQVKLIRCYDPKLKDEKIALLESEPTIIDGKLEIVNAVTDLIE